MRRDSGARVEPTSASVNTHPANGTLLTPEEVALRWRVNVGQVQRLARQGKVPAVKVGRYLRFRLDQVEAWEQGGGAEDHGGEADA